MKKFISFILASLMVLSMLPAMSLAAGTDSLKDKQQALVDTALAFHYKESMQYDSTEMKYAKRANGVPIREHEQIAPEDATPDHTIYTVCSSFCWEVYYNALGFKLTDYHRNFLTQHIIANPPADSEVYHYENTKVAADNDASFEKMLAILEPGDIITMVTSGGGHAMFYAGDVDGDGQGDIIHSTGKKYDMDKGTDNLESDGNIKVADARSFLTSRKITSTYKSYNVIRPLQSVAKDAAITPAAKSRMKYPRLTINRTASVGYYGSVTIGETYNYKIVLKNNSESAFNSITVKEQIPEGTQLAESGGAAVSGNTLTWSVSIPANSEKVLTYSVKATGKPGTVIVSGNGKVDNIPSNTLYTTIRCASLDKVDFSDKEIRTQAAKNAVDSLHFVKNLYRLAAGKKLELPGEKELSNALFHGDRVYEAFLLDLNTTPVTGYETLQKMLVPNWVGGRVYNGFSSAKQNLNPSLKEVMVGDVLCVYDSPASGRGLSCYLFDGNSLVTFEKNGIRVYGAAFMTALLTKNLFFVLRPALAYETDLPEYTARFTDVNPEQWYFPYVEDLAGDRTLNGLTPTTFSPNSSLTYGQALKLICIAAGKGEQAPVTGQSWASGYLKLAQDNGWVSGTVSLTQNINRLQFCQIAAKAKGLKEQPATNPFNDCTDSSVLALYKAGVISGVSDSVFSPGSLLTRAQISKIIWSLKKL